MDILHWPDPILANETQSVEEITDETLALMNEMEDTLRSSGGHGLAANQVGRSESILVYRVQQEEDTDVLEGVMINPQITENGEDVVYYKEGCLSFPGIQIVCQRWKEIVVEFMDADGNQQTLEADGPLAVVLQHEIDHLNGEVFTRFISRIQRDIVNRKMKKMKKKQKILGKMKDKYLSKVVAP